MVEDMDNQTKGVESRPHIARGCNQRSCVIQDQCDRRRPNTEGGPSHVPDEIRGFEVQAPSMIK
jgi:hypothetical protein